MRYFGNFAHVSTFCNEWAIKEHPDFVIKRTLQQKWGPGIICSDSFNKFYRHF